MLKLNKTELEILYEGLTDYVNERITDLSYEDLEKINELQKKIGSAGKLNEDAQLLDKVRFDKSRGYVTGQMGDKMIVMVQGSTYMVDPKDLKEFNKKPDLTVKPHMKFDEKTQKLLFEQYVKCGVYERNVPLRLNDCFVKYSQWEKAKPDQQIKLIVEGNFVFMPKSQVRILENINDFASEENYIPGVIIDQSSEQALENVLINVIDYTNAIGDADSIRVIRETPEGEQEIQTVPRSMVKTLAV